MNIVQQFHIAADSFPSHIAIIYKGKASTYAELQKLVYSKVASLQKAGIKTDDNIMLMIPYGLELYVHILAIFHLGARVVLVDAIQHKKGVLFAYKKANCKGILTTKAIWYLRFFLFHPKLWGRFMSLAKCPSHYSHAVRVSATDSALITFTSGTTGYPKAADRTHDFLTIQLNTLIEEMKIRNTDVHLTSLPVVLMCNLAVGATSIIPPKQNKQKEWRFIKHKSPPTLVSASPTHFTRFLHHLDTSKMERSFIGGATILPHFVEEITKKINPQKVFFAYGSTEAEPIALMSAIDYLLENPKEKGICVGKPHHHLHIKIGEVQDGIIHLLKEGEIGEILVAGNHVLGKYYQDNEAFANNKVQEGSLLWHRTGDLGYVKNRKLYFFGRKKYAWNENENLISPLVYEKYISQVWPSAEATWLRIQGRNVVFASRINATQLLELNQNFPYPIDDVILLSKLPKDKRHLSRIDYEKLISTYGY